MIGDRQIEGWVEGICATRDWQALKTLLQQLPPETAYVLLRVLGERLPLEIDPRQAVANGSDAPGLLISGAILMVRATRARGYATADGVSDVQWEAYFGLQDASNQNLREAAAIRPEDGLAAAWLMAASLDADDDIKDEIEAMIKAANRVPISGHSKVLSARCEKWGGSHAQMWKVARAAAVRRPPFTAALIAKAHYEHALYLDLMDESPDAEFMRAQYFSQSVTEELLAISEDVNQADTPDPYEAIYAHDVLAAVLAEARQRTAAKVHLRKIGKFGDPALLTGGPWWRRMIYRGMKGLPLW